MSEITRNYGKVRLNQEEFFQEEEKYIQQVLQSHSQIKTQIRAWADFLADMYDAGNYSFGKNTICAHICSRLQVEGWTQGEVLLVRRLLPAEYKNELYDNYTNSLSNDNNNNSIYGDFDQVAKGRKSKEELRRMSNAEASEYIKRRRALVKEYQKRGREEINELEEIAEEKQISLEPEKESRDRVPEWMWEITEAYNQNQRIGNYLITVGQRVLRVGELMKEYPPPPDVCARVVTCIQQFFPKIQPVGKILELWCRGFENICINYDDDKYRACPSDWLKIGYDQIATAGSHGSGVINAIRTGEWVFRKSKDPNFDVVMIPLEREFTREQVGDKTAKDLLLKARNMLLKDDIEKAWMDWSKNTIIEETVNTPDDFWKSIKH